MNLALDRYADNPIIDELVFWPPKRQRISRVRACSSLFRKPFIEVELANGEMVTAHCPNTGSMRSCWEPEAPEELSHSSDPKRKLAWTMERVEMGGGWVGVHTGRTNAVMAEAIAEGRIPSLAGYGQLRREVVFELAGHRRSRLDLQLLDGPRADALVEVKNVSLFDDELVRFPDAVTERGRKHLDLLAAALNLIIAWSILRYADNLYKFLGRQGSIVLSRVMGMILTAIGVSYMTRGWFALA